MLGYDSKSVRRRLEALPTHLRLAFALACAERQFVVYAGFSRECFGEEPTDVRTALDGLWRDAAGEETMSDGALSAYNTVFLDLYRQASEAPGTWPQQPQEALITAAHALRTRSLRDSVDEAAHAASHALDAVLTYVGDELKQGHTYETTEHPIVQAELVRQKRDLAELAKASDRREIVERLRARAVEEAPSFLSSPAAPAKPRRAVRAKRHRTSKPTQKKKTKAARRIGRRK